jgi:hypothetical protein
MPVTAGDLLFKGDRGRAVAWLGQHPTIPDNLSTSGTPFKPPCRTWISKRTRYLFSRDQSTSYIERQAQAAKEWCEMKRAGQIVFAERVGITPSFSALHDPVIEASATRVVAPRGRRAVLAATMPDALRVIDAVRAERRCATEEKLRMAKRKYEDWHERTFPDDPLFPLNIDHVEGFMVWYCEPDLNGVLKAAGSLAGYHQAFCAWEKDLKVPLGQWITMTGRYKALPQDFARTRVVPSWGSMRICYRWWIACGSGKRTRRR